MAMTGPRSEAKQELRNQRYDRMGPAEASEGGEPSQALSIALSPQGHLHVHAPERSGLAQIAKDFERGDGHGLFRLGAAEPETLLPGPLGFWRDVGRAFVARLCAIEDLETLRAKLEVEVPPDELAALAAASPPMTGGEYLTPTVLADLCTRMAGAVRDELATWDGTVEGFLRQASPAWNLVGRVCFHLAENKQRSGGALRLPGDLHDAAVGAGESPAPAPRLRRCASTPERATRQRCWPSCEPVQRAARDERRRQGSGRWRRGVPDAAPGRPRRPIGS